MSKSAQLVGHLQQHFGDKIATVEVNPSDEVTMEIEAQYLLPVAKDLRDQANLQFEQLIDLCAVDYHQYGLAQWETENTTNTGFSRGVVREGQPDEIVSWDKPRFAVVYHLLSISLNQRLRLRVFVEGEPPIIDSVIDIWRSANWFEREAFDLFGILFQGHPDLRRILTDYGFMGHPMRKDFPTSGEVEMRYDATLGRVVYEPVELEPRVLVPKVIRHDSRYLQEKAEQEDQNG